MAIYGPGTYINPKEYGVDTTPKKRKHYPYVPLCTCALQIGGCGGKIMKKIEKKVKVIETKVKTTDAKVKNIDSRLTYVEQHTTQTYTKQEIDVKVDDLQTLIDNIPVTKDTYTKTEIDAKVDNLQSQIDNMPSVDTYTKTEIDAKDANLQSQIDDIQLRVNSYTKEEIDDMLTTIVNNQKATDEALDEQIQEAEDVEIKWDEY